MLSTSLFQSNRMECRTRLRVQPLLETNRLLELDVKIDLPAIVLSVIVDLKTGTKTLLLVNRLETVTSRTAGRVVPVQTDLSANPVIELQQNEGQTASDDLTVLPDQQVLHRTDRVVLAPSLTSRKRYQ